MTSPDHGSGANRHTQSLPKKPRSIRAQSAVTPRPLIFISAVSRELQPIWQDIFGTEGGDLRGLLRQQIDQCKGLVQLCDRPFSHSTDRLAGLKGAVLHTRRPGESCPPDAGAMIRSSGRQRVNFDQADTGGSTDTTHNRSVADAGDTRLQGRDDRRFQAICWRNTAVNDRLYLSAASLILSSCHSRPCIMPLLSCNSKSRIRQSSQHRRIGIGQRRSDRTHDHRLRIGPQDDKAANHHIVDRLHEAARGDIGQLGINRTIEVIRLNQRDAGAIVHSADERPCRWRCWPAVS